MKIRDAFVRLLTCNDQINGIGISARTTSVTIFVTVELVTGFMESGMQPLLLLKSAMLLYIGIGRHFALPLPIGGPRNSKSQFACTGVQLKIRVKNVKSVNMTRNTATLVSPSVRTLNMLTYQLLPRATDESGFAS